MSKYYQFKNPVILKISGKDANRYLQSRFTNDIKKLHAGEAIWTAALSPQGKTEGLFVLSQFHDSYLLIASGGDSEKIIQGVRRFLVADRVTVTAMSDLALLHLNTEAGSEVMAMCESCCKIQRIGMLGQDLIIKQSESATVISRLQESGFEQISDSDYQISKITAKHPDFPADVVPDSLFAESQREDAISRNKGCYAGQEVVERLSALGTLPAKIISLSCSGEISAGQEVLCAEKLAGEIISVAFEQSSNQSYAFARIRKANWEQELYINKDNRKIIFSCL